MNKGLIIAIVIILIVIASFTTYKTLNPKIAKTTLIIPEGNPSQETSSQLIEIKSFTFSPESITVKKGTKLTWTNKDSAPHTITSTNDKELDSGTLSQGQSYSHTFTQIGSFQYRCNFHTSMKGTVKVIE